VKFQPDSLSAHISVNTVDERHVRVNGQRFETSFVFGSALAPQTWEQAQQGDFDAAARSLPVLFAKQSGVLLFGTGRRQVFPPVELRRLWAQSDLVVEVMDTAAACRTFNLLASEGRDVNAALLLDPDA
jgi:uncharacterized protein